MVAANGVVYYLRAFGLLHSKIFPRMKLSTLFYIIAAAVLIVIASAFVAKGDNKFQFQSYTCEKVIAVTPEMDAILKADPVYQFLTRVNEASVKKPEWNKCYQCAHYDAFVEEANKYFIELFKKRGLIK